MALGVHLEDVRRQSPLASRGDRATVDLVSLDLAFGILDLDDLEGIALLLAAFPRHEGGDTRVGPDGAVGATLADSALDDGEGHVIAVNLEQELNLRGEGGGDDLIALLLLGNRVLLDEILPRQDNLLEFRRDRVSLGVGSEGREIPGAGGFGPDRFEGGLELNRRNPLEHGNRDVGESVKILLALGVRGEGRRHNLLRNRESFGHGISRVVTRYRRCAESRPPGDTLFAWTCPC